MTAIAPAATAVLSASGAEVPRSHKAVNAPPKQSPAPVGSISSTGKANSHAALGIVIACPFRPVLVHDRLNTLGQQFGNRAGVVFCFGQQGQFFAAGKKQVG